MNKTPEEYFQEQEFAAEALETQEEFTSAEKAFIEKYLGLAEDDLLAKLGIDAPVEAKSVPLPSIEPAPATESVVEGDASQPLGEPETEAVEGGSDQDAVMETGVAPVPEYEEEYGPEETAYGEPASVSVVPDERDELEPETSAAPEALPEELSWEQALRDEPEVQLMSFFLGRQEYTLPIKAVQEVIRYVAPTKLPGAGSLFSGVINLRGKVTPLFKLSELIGMKPKPGAAPEDDEQDKFIIICRHRGLQIGLIVRNVATIYRTPQKQIEWNIESRLGGDIDLVTALMKTGDYLVGVFSIDRIFEKVLRS